MSRFEMIFTSNKPDTKEVIELKKLLKDEFNIVDIVFTPASLCSSFNNSELYLVLMCQQYVSIVNAVSGTDLVPHMICHTILGINEYDMLIELRNRAIKVKNTFNDIDQLYYGKLASKTVFSQGKLLN